MFEHLENLNKDFYHTHSHTHIPAAVAADLSSGKESLIKAVFFYSCGAFVAHF